MLRIFDGVVYDIMELLRDKDPAYYYTDILVPNGRTLSDFINRR